MHSHTDLVYAYNLTNKVIKTLETLERKHNPFRKKTKKRKIKGRNNKTKKKK